MAADVRSVWRLAACVASPLAVAGGGAAVASGVAAVLGRSRPIVRGGFPRGASCLGLIGLERVADRGADVALPGRFVAALGRAVSGVGVPIGLIAVIGCSHGRERSDRRTGRPVVRKARGLAPYARGQKERNAVCVMDRARVCARASPSFARPWSTSPTNTACRSRA